MAQVDIVLASVIGGSLLIAFLIWRAKQPERGDDFDLLDTLEQHRLERAKRASAAAQSPQPDRLAVHVAEAVRSLGYFHEAAIPDLIELCRSQRPFNMGRGIDRAAFEHLLTPGADDDYHGSYVTFLRIHHNLGRDDDIRRLANAPTDMRVQLFCPDGSGCAAAAKKHRSTRSRRGNLNLPLPGCDREWCGCHWSPALD